MNSFKLELFFYEIYHMGIMVMQYIMQKKWKNCGYNVHEVISGFPTISIHPGYPYISGHFIERVHDGRSSTIYKADERVTFFYKENVELETKDYKGHQCLELLNTEKTYILNYMDEHGCHHID